MGVVHDNNWIIEIPVVGFKDMQLLYIFGNWRLRCFGRNAIYLVWENLLIFTVGFAYSSSERLGQACRVFKYVSRTYVRNF